DAEDCAPGLGCSVATAFNRARDTASVTVDNVSVVTRFVVVQHAIAAMREQTTRTACLRDRVRVLIPVVTLLTDVEKTIATHFILAAIPRAAVATVRVAVVTAFELVESVIATTRPNRTTAR